MAELRKIERNAKGILAFLFISEKKPPPFIANRERRLDSFV